MKQYRCRIYRVLTHDATIEAKDAEQALDWAKELAMDMSDDDFEWDENDAEILETINDKKDTEEKI